MGVEKMKTKHGYHTRTWPWFCFCGQARWWLRLGLKRDLSPCCAHLISRRLHSRWHVCVCVCVCVCFVCVCGWVGGWVGVGLHTYIYICRYTYMNNLDVWSVCVCVFVCVYIYTHLCVCTYIHIHTYIYIHTHTYYPCKGCRRWFKLEFSFWVGFVVTKARGFIKPSVLL